MESIWVIESCWPQEPWKFVAAREFKENADAECGARNSHSVSKKYRVREYVPKDEEARDGRADS